MENKIVQQAQRAGLLRNLPDGRQAVHVSLSQPEKIQAGSYKDLKAKVHSYFGELEGRMKPLGVSFVGESLSASAQSIEALLPVDRIEDIGNVVKDEHLRCHLVESLDARMA